MKILDGTKSAKVIQVIETKAKRGLGIEKDPVRDVTQYWSLDGKFLAEYDQSSLATTNTDETVNTEPAYTVSVSKSVGVAKKK